MTDFDNYQKNDFEIITDQELVHAYIFAQQILPKIFSIGEELYPNDNEETFLFVSNYPLKEDWVPKEIINKVRKLIIDISVEDNFSLLYVHEVVEAIAANFSKEVEILYSVMKNSKSSKMVKVFITTNEKNDTIKFLWNT